MHSEYFEFTAKLWLYSGEGAWYFVTLPQNIAEIVQETRSATRSGFGSVKVKARIGNTDWQTSIFPDKKTDSYLLPIKKEIRIRNSLDVNDDVKVKLSIMEFL